MAAYIDHDGLGIFFPARHCRIWKRPPPKQAGFIRRPQSTGWNNVCRRFLAGTDCEFRVVHESGVVDLYHHSYPGRKTGGDGFRISRAPIRTGSAYWWLNWMRASAGLCAGVLTSKRDLSVFLATQWNPSRQTLAVHKPRMVLLNRNLAGAHRLQIQPAPSAPLQPGVPALTYSVHVDGDQMFVSTPGGAGGYLVKRVQAGPVAGADPQRHSAGRN